ncbi:MAG: hypothetical protein JKY37_02140 [Nannocystaceae bacterium]|nr:hypothetical protein [Nannocystaceae bacterium]
MSEFGVSALLAATPIPTSEAPTAAVIETARAKRIIADAPCWEGAPDTAATEPVCVSYTNLLTIACQKWVQL